MGAKCPICGSEETTQFNKVTEQLGHNPYNPRIGLHMSDLMLRCKKCKFEWPHYGGC